VLAARASPLFVFGYGDSSAAEVEGCRREGRELLKVDNRPAHSADRALLFLYFRV
jgi:hypothetical protein